MILITSIMHLESFAHTSNFVKKVQNVTVSKIKINKTKKYIAFKHNKKRKLIISTVYFNGNKNTFYVNIKLNGKSNQ